MLFVLHRPFIRWNRPQIDTLYSKAASYCRRPPSQLRSHRFTAFSNLPIGRQFWHIHEGFIVPSQKIGQRFVFDWLGDDLPTIRLQIGCLPNVSTSRAGQACGLDWPWCWWLRPIFVALTEGRIDWKWEVLWEYFVPAWKSMTIRQLFRIVRAFRPTLASA